MSICKSLAFIGLLQRLSPGKPGQFVELGALDGVTGSNTLGLEACYGWSGLLIEANPTNFRRLQRSGRQSAID